MLYIYIIVVYSCCVCKALAVDAKAGWSAVLDHVRYDRDQAQADECCRAVYHDASCDVNDLVVVECSISFHKYYFFIHIYYRVDSVVRLQKSRSDPDQVQHPGPWTAAEDQDPAQEKPRILHGIPQLVAPDSHDPDQAKTRNQGQTPGKSTGAGKKS